MIIQDALKLTRHSKRLTMTTSDIDHTLKMKDYEVSSGCSSVPLRVVSD